jgi:hypothetical protein
MFRLHKMIGLLITVLAFVADMLSEHVKLLQALAAMLTLVSYVTALVL